MGVDRAMEKRNSSDCEEEAGAGDQGMMFGYATDETEEYMPAPLVYAHRLTRQLDHLRKEGYLQALRPDGKAQVTVLYGENGEPEEITAIVVSAQHEPEFDQGQLKNDICGIISYTLPSSLITENTKIYVNPTGRFVVGGPKGDSGLTGRKIIVDTYGGVAHHGGGAFSGKDCSKVDRSAAYYARYVAKNIVAAGIAKRCEVQISYAIGMAEPMSVNIETFGTNTWSEKEIMQAVMSVFDFRPTQIIKQLDLKKPIYKQTASYGHFGRK